MKRRSLWFSASMLFLVAASGGGFAQPKITASAPMEVRGNLPFVQVMVNGKGPFAFGIDTGTGGEAVFSADLIQLLDLPVTGEETIGDPSGVNGKKVPVVRIDSLKVAGVEFKNVEATQYPGKMLEKTDGILGFVLFKDYLVTLDYPKQTMTLASGSLPPADGTEVIPFSMPNNVPVIELTVGSRKIDAHVDSRGHGLSFPDKFAAGFQFVSDPVVIGRGRTVSNEFEVKGAQLASDVHFGGYTFSKPFVTINPVFPIANFGSAALQNFAVTFDQRNKLVRFQASSKTIVIAPPQKTRMPQSPPKWQPTALAAGPCTNPGSPECR